MLDKSLLGIMKSHVNGGQLRFRRKLQAMINQEHEVDKQMAEQFDLIVLQEIEANDRSALTNRFYQRPWAYFQHVTLKVTSNADLGLAMELHQ